MSCRYFGETLILSNSNMTQLRQIQVYGPYMGVSFDNRDPLCFGIFGFDQRRSEVSLRMVEYTLPRSDSHVSG